MGISRLLMFAIVVEINGGKKKKPGITSWLRLVY
jgi:hypothetical protein